jgi:hypothetical protein
MVRRVPAGKTVRVIIRVSPEERAAWRAEAARDDRNLSNWMKRTCNAEVERRKKQPAAATANDRDEEIEYMPRKPKLKLKPKPKR